MASAASKTIGSCAHMNSLCRCRSFFDSAFIFEMSIMLTSMQNGVDSGADDQGRQPETSSAKSLDSRYCESLHPFSPLGAVGKGIQWDARNPIPGVENPQSGW